MMRTSSTSAQLDWIGSPSISPADIYPHAPGWREPETSKAAAEMIAPRAKVLREKVFNAIVASPSGLSVHQIAVALDMPVATVQPRVSELRRDCRIKTSGKRHTNESGATAHVWIVWPENERGV